MQSIIYRRIKYILYIADKPWWVLHMYSMYVNFYLQSFLHIQKPCFYFLCIYLYREIYLFIYIYRFLYTPHQHLYYNEKKKKTFTYMSIHFFFLYYKCIPIKIYLCTKSLLFINITLFFTHCSYAACSFSQASHCLFCSDVQGLCSSR